MLTKRMIQTLMVVVALFATFATTPKASADFQLTIADIDANLPVGDNDPGPPLIGPPVVDINNIDSTNETYTNTYFIANPGNPADIVGNKVRTIVTGRLDSFQRLTDPVGGTIDAVAGAADSGKSISFIAVLDGVIVSAAGGAVVSYDTGRAGVFEVGNLNTFLGNDPLTPLYSVSDPSTWGFDAAGAGGSGAFAEWELGPKTEINVDTGLSVSTPVSANVVNTGSVDALAPTLQTQGRFLFIEDSVDPQDPGNEFIEILNNLIAAGNDGVAVNGAGNLSLENTTVPAGDIQAEGIFIDVADTIKDDEIGDPSLDAAAADLAILNQIGIWGTTNADNPGGISVDGNPANGFATSFGGATPGDFTPFFVNGISQTGDFIATGDLDIRPGVLTDVPEPTTALLGLMGLAGIGLRRRRNA